MLHINRTIKILAAVAAAAALACATLAGCASIKGETPAQIAAQVCPPIQTALTSLAALPGWTADQKATLENIQPSANAVCQAGTSVNTANLQTLASTGFPALIAIIRVSPLNAQEQSTAILGLSATEIILEAVLAANPSATLVSVPSQSEIDTAVKARPFAAMTALARRPQ